MCTVVHPPDDPRSNAHPSFDRISNNRISSNRISNNEISGAKSGSKDNGISTEKRGSIEDTSDDVSPDDDAADQGAEPEDI